MAAAELSAVWGSAADCLDAWVEGRQVTRSTMANLSATMGEESLVKSPAIVDQLISVKFSDAAAAAIFCHLWG